MDCRFLKNVGSQLWDECIDGTQVCKKNSYFVLLFLGWIFDEKMENLHLFVLQLN